MVSRLEIFLSVLCVCFVCGKIIDFILLSPSSSTSATNVKLIEMTHQIRCLFHYMKRQQTWKLNIYQPTWEICSNGGEKELLEMTRLNEIAFDEVMEIPEGKMAVVKFTSMWKL